MANSPESFHQKPLDFRAPPPSPVASGRRSSVANDEILTEFLHQSLRVPDLILPDRVFPRQKSKIQDLPKLDFGSLDSLDKQEAAQTLDLIAKTGCFELVNHGISNQLFHSLVNSGAGIFELPPEKKALITRSADRLYGFVEFHGEEKETSEEFVWCRDDLLKSQMEGIWPLHYSNFSEKMERLVSKIDKMAGFLLKLLLENAPQESGVYDDGGTKENEMVGSICYLYKHHGDTKNMVPSDDEYMSSLRYDVIRMLIRGSEHSHALCFHLCNGSSEFHVYSKKGWVSCCPNKESLVITIGDQLQRWSGGKYKHVIGRPIFKEEDDSISMAFLYTPPPVIVKDGNEEKKITIAQQAFLVLILSIFYNVFVHLCN